MSAPMSGHAGPRLETNDRLIMTVRSTPLRNYQVSAVVDEVRDDGRMALQLSCDAAFAPLRAGETVALDLPVADGIWRMRSRIVEVHLSDDGSTHPALMPDRAVGPLVEVTPPLDPRKLEGRRYQRLPVRIAARAQAIDGIPRDVDTLEDLADSAPAAHIVSLGAGGLGLQSDEPLRIGDLVVLGIDAAGLPDILLGHVVWSDPATQGSRVGVSFVNVDDDDQDLIIDYVMLARTRH